MLGQVSHLPEVAISGRFAVVTSLLLSHSACRGLILRPSSPLKLPGKDKITKFNKYFPVPILPHLLAAFGIIDLSFILGTLFPPMALLPVSSSTALINAP